MKKVVVGLVCIVATSAVYSAIPSEPKPIEGELAVQVVKVEHPTKIDVTLDYVHDAEEIFKDGSNTLTQYPTLYVAEGSVVTNDQTTSVAFPEDYDISNGKAIPKEKIIKLGRSIVVELSNRRDNTVDIKIKFENIELKGYDNYSISNDMQVKVPYLDTIKFNRDCSVALGDWMVLGGGCSTLKKK